VLDNADDPRVDYQRYIPAGPSGMVMLTSRNEQCKRYATQKHILLDSLPDTEARELLLSAADVPSNQRQTLQDDAQAITTLLRSHPLALILAGSYVSRGHCTLAQYPSVYEKQRRRLLTFELTQVQSRYRDVYATFEALADILQSSPTESAGDALQLLPVLATCGPSRLPLPLFEAGWKGAQSVSLSNTDDDDTIQLTPWHVSHLLPFMQADADTWDSFRLIEAISLLKALSLVSTNIYTGFLSVSMHPLTNAWARDRQGMAEQHESWVATACLMALSRSRGDFWRQHGRQLQPHVQALTGCATSEMFASGPVMKVTSILVNCGWLLYDMRDDAKVFVLMNSLLTHLGLDRQIVDKRWAEVYELTARNLINYGKIKEAVLLLEQVVKIREQTLAEDHPSRLASQHVLAMAYEANRQVREAVSLLEQVVKIRELTLAEDHPDQLDSQHALAMAYQANGQVREAVSLLEQVVKIREQTLAEDHPDRLASQQVLATMYWDLGRRNNALQMTKNVVEIRRRVLDEHHPARTGSEWWLNYFEREMGNSQPT
jgi:tetratricopeptide (TPR) repeat protein